MLKFDCARRDLFSAVGLAGIAAAARSPLPILQNLKIEVADSKLVVVGCDGEMWIEASFACMAPEPGAACLNGKLLSEILSKLPDGDVSFESEGREALLTEGASEYRLLPLDAEDFPPVPEPETSAELRLPMATFRDAVDSVAFAVAGEAHRPILTGVFLRYDGQILTLVATDTYRLAVRRVEMEGLGSDVKVVVPEKALRAIKALPVADDEMITIKFNEDRLYVESAGARIVSQLLVGDYLNWERVVPSEPTKFWQIDADQLKDNLQRALIVAKDSAYRVKFVSTDGRLLLSAKSEDRGEAKEELDIVSTGGDAQIAFNGRYVLDALAPVKGDGVRIEMTESSRAAVLRSTEHPHDYYCVIMPMSLA